MDWIKRRAEYIAALPTNWDGFGAEPILPSTLSAIEGLLRQLLPAVSRPGSIVPAADGSVQAEWHLPEMSFALLVEEDGIVSSWVRPVDGDEIEAHGEAGKEMFRSLAAIALV